MELSSKYIQNVLRLQMYIHLHAKHTLHHAILVAYETPVPTSYYIFECKNNIVYKILKTILVLD